MQNIQMQNCLSIGTKSLRSDCILQFQLFRLVILSLVFCIVLLSFLSYWFGNVFYLYFTDVFKWYSLTEELKCLHKIHSIGAYLNENICLCVFIVELTVSVVRISKFPYISEFSEYLRVSREPYLSTKPIFMIFYLDFVFFEFPDIFRFFQASLTIPIPVADLDFFFYHSLPS